VTYFGSLIRLFGFLRRNANTNEHSTEIVPAVYLSPFQKLFNRIPCPLTVIAGRKGTRMHSILDGLDRRRPVGHARRTTLGTNRAVQEPELLRGWG
jgi:hypothetical protein